MKRFPCLQALAGMLDDELVVVGIAGTFWEWVNVSDHEGTMTISALGCAGASALGMALALPHRRVISLDGDGSTLLDLAVLPTIATYQPQNLSVFVFDNQAYSGSRISNPTATAFRTNLELMAKGAGIAEAVTVTDFDEFKKHAEAAVSGDRLQYVVVKVEEDTSARKLPKPRQDFIENKYHFVRYVERTEKISILPTIR